MGSRTTMAWVACQLCGRKTPPVYCRRLDAWVCPWCAATIGCGEERRSIPRRRVRALAPDEELIESIAQRRKSRSRG